MTVSLRIRPGRIIGPESDPYMLRWHLFRVWNLPRFYLHKFVRSDYDRALHNHPWWYVSILLRGQYIEHTDDGPIHRTAPSIVFRPLGWKHRVELIKECVTRQGWIPSGQSSLRPVREQPCWTLFLTGPDVRQWGFFCPEGFVDSADFQGCE